MNSTDTIAGTLQFGATSTFPQIAGVILVSRAVAETSAVSV